MNKVIYILYIFLPSLTFSQDTIISNELIGVLKGSVYLMHYNGKPFSGIQKNINVFNWDIVNDQNTMAISIPKEDRADTIKMEDVPNVNSLKPHEYAISYIEFKKGIGTGNQISYVNGKILSIHTLEGKKKTFKEYYFEEGDTVPGTLEWKFKYFKNIGLSEKRFDNKGHKTRNIKYYKVGSKKLKKGIRIKRSYYEFKSETEDSLYSYNTQRGYDKRKMRIHTLYYVNKDGSKGSKWEKIISKNNEIVKSIEYDRTGRLIRKNKFK